MLTAPVPVRYAAPVTGVPVTLSFLLHPEAINSAPAIAAVMLVALTFFAFTQLSAVDWLELEKNAFTCQQHDTNARAFMRRAIVRRSSRARSCVRQQRGNKRAEPVTWSASTSIVCCDN